MGAPKQLHLSSSSSIRIFFESSFPISTAKCRELLGETVWRPWKRVLWKSVSSSEGKRIPRTQCSFDHRTPIRMRSRLQDLSLSTRRMQRASASDTWTASKLPPLFYLPSCSANHWTLSFKKHCHHTHHHEKNHHHNHHHQGNDHHRCNHNWHH